MKSSALNLDSPIGIANPTSTPMCLGIDRTAGTHLNAPAIRSRMPLDTITIWRYSILLYTAPTELASSTVRISLPSLTITRDNLRGTGLFGVVTSAVPVQFALTL